MEDLKGLTKGSNGKKNQKRTKKDTKKKKGHRIVRGLNLCLSLSNGSNY
jgi:hypothetical protein